MHETTRILSILVTILAISRFSTADDPKPELINGNATWSEKKTIDHPITITDGLLTLSPGTQLTFTNHGNLSFRKASLLARGTPQQPIEFVATQAGMISGQLSELQLDHCSFKGLGALAKEQPRTPDNEKKPPQRQHWLLIDCGERGASIRNCQFDDCDRAIINSVGPIVLQDCTVHQTASLTLGSQNKLEILHNAVQHGTLSFNRVGESVLIRDNVLIQGTLSGPTTNQPQSENVIVEFNYIHNPWLTSIFGLLNITGKIRNNVIRGGTWVTCAVGGHISENVLETLSPEEIERSKAAGYKDQTTHEQIAGLRSHSIVERNILVNGSYGAIMGAAQNLCADCVLQNNTFDLRRRTAPIYLNHLPKGTPKGLVIRNNLFLRGGPILDEVGIADTIAYADYNFWGDAGGKRFSKITITGKKPGDDGFGAHDLPPLTEGERKFDSKEIVEDPEVALNFTDEQMVARTHTVQECLELYRKAYIPRLGSPVLNAGRSTNTSGSSNQGERRDIGAVERH